MAAKRKAFAFDHPIIITFLVFAILAFMYFAAEVLQPLALALLFSLALTPLSDAFERRGVPRVGSVVLAVVIALSVLGGVGYVVGSQLTGLADQVASDELRQNLREKVRFLAPREESAMGKLARVGGEMAETLEKPAIPTDITDAQRLAPADADVSPPQRVQVVSQPSFQERLQTAVGPWLQILAVGSVVLILVVFMMINREDLSDRIVRLVGTRRITLTTRTLEELAQRIGRFLAILVTYNAAMGLLLGLGLAALGVPYAATWGTLGALLRFIPYVGPVSAFLLPAGYALAYFPGWWQALAIVGIYATFETFMSSFVEPIMYGRTTGISAVGLLVAIMFWTWLWGPIGLLLATPLTVCLAVLGKYVPQLHGFATLLIEDVELHASVRFYQRLIAIDQDGAAEIVEEALKARPRAEVFDEVLIPALSRLERDQARGEVDEAELTFAWRVVGDLIEDLEGTQDLDLASVTALPRLEPDASSTGPVVLGVAANDHGDALALRMLRQLLAQANCPMEIVTSDFDRPLEMVEAVGERAPRLVVLSHLPPVGLTPARYLVRRLRALHPGLPVYVGRWGEGGNPEQVADRLKSSGATAVVFSLADARLRLLEALAARSPQPVGAP